ncbi:SulP family inorganic anion transporter [Ramlibacter alkalitolerans]|uniref:STAS domain-containing protein n=1 Tax=Ramlibacter alkalitolerans TaxID=2039631 RepID=A0ABS1JPX5_9BURK|nr:SulP family inorganic anion transporter [Ramlibacter alkalitolerans]MBL0426298.1 STAS domain-containing protein [Ramlibacter alkalitolerans]
MLSFAFRPRLLDALRGYDRARFSRDLGAGLTVGIVALPLAMAFAIASGLKPEAGLWTAIIAGLAISLFGGSSVQIGGPAGAFIVIVYGIVERYGLANLLIATTCAGVLLFAMGLLRLGRLVRYVPVSIVIGFTNGIAVLIAASQVKDWLGLSIPRMPADFFAQLRTLATHLDSFNPFAFVLGTACFVGLFLWPRLWHSESPVKKLAQQLPGMHEASEVGARIPGPIVALVTLTALAWYFRLPVETIGTKFGSIPQGLPAFRLPDFSWDTVKQLVSPTLTIAALGAIESLLCARVADQVSNLPRHDPNQELMAQGIANFVVPFFGGMPATGTIARTVTNIRAGGTSPVAGVIHAVTLAVVVLAAGPLALLVPLSVLAGILFFVAWNMGEWREFAHLKKYSTHYRLLMTGTFALTVVFDLTVAVQVGLLAACVLFIQKMSSLFSVALAPTEDGTLRYDLYGSLFFGATAKIDPIVQAVESLPPGSSVVLDALHLVHLDTSGLDALRQLHKVILLRQGSLAMENLHEQPREVIERAGFLLELERHLASEEVAA